MSTSLPPDTLRRILLRQPTRALVHAAIQRVPGTHVRALSRHLDLALGTVEHHVRQLEKHGIVFALQTGRRRTLYVAGEVDVRDAQVLHVLAKPVCAAVLRGLLERPEIGVADLALHLDLPASTLGHHLRRLKEQGLVVHHQVGRESIYLVLEPVRIKRLLAQETGMVALVGRARGAANIERIVADH